MDEIWLFTLAAQGQRIEARGVWSGGKASNLNAELGFYSQWLLENGCQPTGLRGRTSSTHTAFLNSGNEPLQSRHAAAPRLRAPHRPQNSGDLSHSKSTTTQHWVIEHSLNEVLNNDMRVCKHKSRRVLGDFKMCRGELWKTVHTMFCSTFHTNGIVSNKLSQLLLMG